MQRVKNRPAGMHYKSHATRKVKAFSENKGFYAGRLDSPSLTCSMAVDLLSRLRFLARDRRQNLKHHVATSSDG
jgi:hypothetical protein